VASSFCSYRSYGSPTASTIIYRLRLYEPLMIPCCRCTAVRDHQTTRPNAGEKLVQLLERKYRCREGRCVRHPLDETARARYRCRRARAPTVRLPSPPVPRESTGRFLVGKLAKSLRFPPGFLCEGPRPNASAPPWGKWLVAGNARPCPKGWGSLHSRMMWGAPATSRTLTRSSLCIALTNSGNGTRAPIGPPKRVVSRGHHRRV
jgi:hypothetical protein